MNSYEFVSVLIAIIGTFAWIVGYFLTHNKNFGEKQ